MITPMITPMDTLFSSNQHGLETKAMSAAAADQLEFSSNQHGLETPDAMITPPPACQFSSNQHGLETFNNVFVDEIAHQRSRLTSMV